MNKQELIKEFREVGIYSLNILGTEIKAIPTEIAITSIEQLDESQKIVVPQFVADWYEENKDNFEGNLFRYIINISSIFDGAKINEFERWFLNASTKPFQTLVNMHQFGYEVEKEVEKEKEYKVVLLNYNDGHLNLVNVRTLGENIIFFTKKTQFDPRSLKLTKAEIISSGFGWVFDCPGIKIEEVE